MTTNPPMNRKQRRALEKQYQMINKRTPDVSKARADGRPQYYDITAGDRVQCVKSMAEGIDAQFGRGEAFLNDPANSPVIDRKTRKPDGGVYSICKAYLPDNAVIYDPMTGQCRNKSGDNTWTE